MLRRVAARRRAGRRLARAEHERLQAGGHHERRGRVDEQHLEELERRDLVQREPPRVVRSEIHLLEILVEDAPREELERALPGEHQVGVARGLREERRARHARGPAVVRERRPQLLVIAHERALDVGHVARRSLLALEEVGVEAGRPAHGLAGVVELEVEARERRVEPLAEELDARRVAQVDAVDREPVLPVREVRLARVARRRVAREARAGDHAAACAEQEDGGLIADLHAGAGDERHAPPQIDGRAAPREVLVATGAAQLIVERVEPSVGRLADVALARLRQLRTLVGPAGRRRPRRASGRCRGRAAATSRTRRCPRGAAGGAASRTPAPRGAAGCRCPSAAPRPAPSSPGARCGAARAGASSAASGPGAPPRRRVSAASSACRRRPPRAGCGPRRRARGPSARSPRRRWSALPARLRRAPTWGRVLPRGGPPAKHTALPPGARTSERPHRTLGPASGAATAARPRRVVRGADGR